MPASNEPSPTHQWLSAEGRRIALEPGKLVLHRLCTICQRNFVRDLTTGEWYGAIPRMFDFERLYGVSERWLSEPCPGVYRETEATAKKSGG